MRERNRERERERERANKISNTDPPKTQDKR
jgi:hypothetical protein